MCIRKKFPWEVALRASQNWAQTGVLQCYFENKCLLGKLIIFLSCCCEGNKVVAKMGLFKEYAGFAGVVHTEQLWWIWWKSQTGAFICSKQSQAVSSRSHRTSLWSVGFPSWHTFVNFSDELQKRTVEPLRPLEGILCVRLNEKPMAGRCDFF